MSIIIIIIKELTPSHSAWKTWLFGKKVNISSCFHILYTTSDLSGWGQQVPKCKNTCAGCAELLLLLVKPIVLWWLLSFLHKLPIISGNSHSSRAVDSMNGDYMYNKTNSLKKEH